MTALTIDTLAIVQILRKRGFSEEQAVGVVEAFREIDAGLLATKSDIREVAAKIETSAANLKWTFSAGSSSCNSRSAASFSRR